MCAIRWSAASRIELRLVEEDSVRRAVPGPVKHAQRAVAQLELLAVGQRLG